MATKQAKQASAKPAKNLAGQKLAFVGKFGYRDWWRKDFVNWAKSAGAAVVDSGKTFDLLVVGEGRGGKPPGEVAKILKRLPNVQELSLAEFAQLVLPDAGAFASELKKGGENLRTNWDDFEFKLRTAAVSLDLSGTDLRGANLFGAQLIGVKLDGADLRKANAEYTHFDKLRDVNFDGVNGKNVYFGAVDDCTFRGAILEKAWFFFETGKSVAVCDFTGARMQKARSERGKFARCNFANANLSDAEMESVVVDSCDFTGADLSRIHARKAKFTDSKFVNATLRRADLRESSLNNADLRGADFRDAALGEADLTGANVAGADFAGAVLTGATLAGVDFSKAKNYTPPVARKAGPRLKELAAAAGAKGPKGFQTSAEVDLGKGEHASLVLYADRSGNNRLSASSRYHRDGDSTHDWIAAPSVERGLMNMADRWPNATLRLDTVKASGSKTVRGQKLKDLAVAAWAEAFAVQLATPDDLDQHKEAQHDQATRARDKLMKRIRAEGGEVWNSLDYRARDRIDLRGIDLGGAKLNKLNMWGRADLREAQFVGAKLTGAEFWGSTLQSANFADADLTRAALSGCKCEKASFVNAKLTKADLSSAKLQGADFTGAKLTDANLEKAQFDEHTKFPVGFKPPAGMTWKGTGPRPGLRAVKQAAGSMDFPTFLKKLDKTVDVAKLRKATAMLKAEKFQLFADVTDDAVSGVVRSQSDDELVYSCELTSGGEYGCGTQNLKPCGGLQGTVCKHLLVLVVGLAKAGKLDPATAHGWLAESKKHQPTLDKDATGATFLKYKGAEAGEIDWRPTETVPEDFYSA